MGNIITQYQVSASAPSVVGGTGTSRKFFPATPGPSIGVSRTTPSSTNSKGQLIVPGNNRLAGELFKIDAIGYVQTDGAIACPSILLELLAQTNTTTDGHNPTYTSIAQFSSAADGNTLAEPFRVSAEVSGDSVSGIVAGVQLAMYNGVVDDSPWLALENNLSNINFNADVPFGLVFAVTFSVSGAGNSASLTQFSISQ